VRYKFDYRCVDEWARLAWVARALDESDRIEIMHGPKVETRPEWFCEAVWPGPFDEGCFDRTDLIAGSGGRVRDGLVRFVSAGNTVDRLVLLRTKRDLFVSNSLPCLLAGSGARLDPTYAGYLDDALSIVRGLDAFKSTIPSSLGTIEICFFGCVEWDGHTHVRRLKEPIARDFADFSRYVHFLRENLRALARNMADPSRKCGRYRFLATVSSGYDSATVAALAREAGCEDALAIDVDRFGDSERGDVIARQLGLNPIVVRRDAWRDVEGVEVAFIAADGSSEAVSLAGAAPALPGRVLLTGYHGDKMWAKDTVPLDENVVRGDSSGLSMSEYRLWAGYIHAPITFWGVRQIRDLNRISNSDDMRPWNVAGDYSRPICRRIVETAGVPRDAFGRVKRAAAVGYRESLGPASLDRYHQWLRERRLLWLARGRLPPLVSARYEAFSLWVFHSIQALLLRAPLIWRFARDAGLEYPTRFRRHAFAWAVECMTARYVQALNARATTIRETR
jgi:hypothetical protein